MCLPLVVLGWVGLRLARQERDMATQRTRDLLVARLADTDRIIADYFDTQRRSLATIADAMVSSPDSIRDTILRDPLIDNAFLLSPDGQLIHPNLNSLSQRESTFISTHGDMVRDINTPADDEQTATITGSWTVRFAGQGVNIFYNHASPGGQTVAILLARARWMADVIANLPDTPIDEEEVDTQIRLINANGDTVYAWGRLANDNDTQPFAELPISEPLAAWRLQYLINPDNLTASTAAYFNMLSLLAVCGLVIIVGGLAFHREYTRRVTEATQRVSFVNHVSHELKTPLTNIRMYAELLDEHIDGESDDKQRRHLDIIVEESQRLTRLIGNVLTLGKSQRDQLNVRPRPAIVDDAIRDVAQLFKPSFDRRKVSVDMNLDAPATVNVDVDAVEQIVGNLLNNVEKYAAQGQSVTISSTQTDATTTITVADQGPGIPADQHERIFSPFARLSNHIADSPGTGIGLTIARELARRHGGDLSLVPTDKGACFLITLNTPAAQRNADA